MGTVTSLLSKGMVGGYLPLILCILVIAFPMISSLRLGTSSPQNKERVADLDKILETGDCWARVDSALDKFIRKLDNYQIRKRSFASFRWRPTVGLNISEDDIRLRNKAHEMMNLLQKLIKGSPTATQ